MKRELAIYDLLFLRELYILQNLIHVAYKTLTQCDNKNMIISTDGLYCEKKEEEIQYFQLIGNNLLIFSF